MNINPFAKQKNDFLKLKRFGMNLNTVTQNSEGWFVCSF